MATFFTHTTLSLGDNMWSLQYLRKQAMLYPEHRFVHAAPFNLLSQLIEVVADLPNLSLIDFDYKPHYSLFTWVNSDNFIDNHPDKWNIARVLVDFFEVFSKKIGLESGLKNPADLAYDYPSITRTHYTQNFDFMVINSQPLSDQFLDFAALNGLVGELVERGHTIVTTAKTEFQEIVCTTDHKLTITQIGSLSLNCKHILGVATGPMWPTFNTFNAHSVELRLLLLTDYKVNISPNTVHAETTAIARNILKDRGLL